MSGAQAALKYKYQLLSSLIIIFKQASNPHFTEEGPEVISLSQVAEQDLNPGLSGARALGMALVPIPVLRLVQSLLPAFPQLGTVTVSFLIDRRQGLLYRR